MRIFSWWCSFTFRGSRYFLLPDSTGRDFVVVALATLVPYFIFWPGRLNPLWFLALLIPFSMLGILRVSSDRVQWIKLFLFLPYYSHKLPSDAKFSLFQAWEDKNASGVAFDSKTYGASPLHLGNSSNAAALFSVIKDALLVAGWKQVGSEIRRSP